MPSSSKGFTLVELAIVMVIIGLLISGILKGQELVESAKVKSFVSQIKGYQAAVNVFQDRYNALPGDFRTATTRIPGCDGTNFCVNGNGNTIIGTTLTDWSNDSNNQLGSGSPAVETSMFWKHLFLADLISGVAGNANPTSAAFGSTHPSSKLSGGFFALTAHETGEFQANGNFIAWRGVITADTQPWSTGSAPANPSLAARLDTIIDDGNAKTGSAKADYAAGEGCANSTTGAYLTTVKSRTCIMIFKF